MGASRNGATRARAIAAATFAIVALAISVAPGQAFATTNVSVTGAALTVQGDGSVNHLRVYVGPNGNLRVDDTGGQTAVAIGAGCSRPDTNNHHAACNPAGVTLLRANLGESPDEFKNDTSLQAEIRGEGNSYGIEILTGGTGFDLIDGGTGADQIGDTGGNSTRLFGAQNFLFGGPNADKVNGSVADDYLDGGSGVDVLKGGSGINTLNLLDGEKDGKSNCGPDGRSTVTKDAIDPVTSC